MINDPKWIEVKCKGELTGQEYFGRFSVKPFLNKAESSDAVRLAELLSRGISEDVFTRSFLRLGAFLKFHIVESDAKWWSSGKDGDAEGVMNKDLFDEAPVYALSEELDKLRVSVNPGLQKKATDETKTAE